jgi:hypothetical protein
MLRFISVIGAKSAKSMLRRVVTFFARSMRESSRCERLRRGTLFGDDHNFIQCRLKNGPERE